MKQIKNKRAAFVIMLVMLMAMVFPVLVGGFIDLGNAFHTSKHLKTSLNAATKSAASRIDWSQVPQGTFVIDTAKAQTAFQDIMDSNMGTASTYNGSYYEYQTASGLYVRYYLAIFNGRHEGVWESFPMAGSIPPSITTQAIQTQVDRPTVVAVARVDYKVLGLFGGQTLHIVQASTAQLNVLPQNRQPSATYP